MINLHPARADGLWFRHVRQASLSLLLTLLVAPLPALAATNAATTALHRLLDAEWEYTLKEFPEHATALGDHRYDDRLTDRSAAAVEARRAHHRATLAAVRAIDRSKLEGEDRLSWDILEFTTDLDVRGDDLLRSAPGAAEMPFSADDSPMSVNPMSGPQFNLPQMVRATRFASEADYRHYLARLSALPTSLSNLRAILDAGRRAGWMPPREAITRLVGQYAPLVAGDLAHHPLYAPFQKYPADLPGPVQEELTRSGPKVMQESVIPALTMFRDYLAQTWVPASTTTLGAVNLPHGEAYYAWALQRYTTTRMTAKEIHELGLREVARLDGEMRAIMKEVAFEGTIAQFRDYLRTDKKFQFSTADEELAAFRDIAKRVDPQLPSLFVELPRVPYGIRPMSPEEGNNAPHYIAGALDGTRAGYFEANTNNLAAWPKWTMDALFLHEAVPGHHLQIARGQEMPGLPKLRRAYGNSGFSEGWGLYSEGLGRELGLYTDPYSRFGRLTLEAHRACRLVVDTGMHAFGWTRQQAIDYLIDHAQLERGFAEAEVDRYITWPGQATAYKVGEQDILANRAKARAALGARFDIRRFHNAVIDHGGLPLTVLDRVIDEWIVAERARPAE
jgi:uncharacterized protein (DUF885 family)